MPKLTALLLLISSVCSLVWARPAAADISIDAPSGLIPGQTFRIIFVTDGTTTAASTAIGDYNTFVSKDATTEAGGGSVTYEGKPLKWAAVISTATVSAIDNVLQLGSPVFMASGVGVAISDTLNSGGLWSGQPLGSPINQDLLGKTTGFPFAWTGTDEHGAQYFGYAMGTNTPENGDLNDRSRVWDSGTSVQSNSYPIYGISQQLTVPAFAPSTPEPASLAIWSGLIVLAAGVYCRSRRLA